jgi:CubicO group peptidase (beta-lactamase class C family)
MYIRTLALVATVFASCLGLGCASRQQAGTRVARATATAAAPVVAADQGHSSGRATGFDEGRLARIAEVMQRGIGDGSLPGAVTLIARHGQIVHFETHGLRDRERQVPMTKDTLFRIYSMTKPITSVAAMMLYEEGRFDLEDRLAEYLPEFANVQVAIDPDKHENAIKTRKPARPITIRDLLRHTAGLTYGAFGDTSVDREYRKAGVLSPTKTNAEVVTQLATIPLQFDPGSRWHYSAATDVLGRLVEVISGQTLGEYFARRIFEPLGMKDTFFRVPPDKLSRLATMYSEVDGALQPSPPSEIERYTSANTKFESGGGGLVSTASDYLRFCEMLRRGGELEGKRLLAPRTVALMSQNHLTVESPIPGFGFGLGFAVTSEPGKLGVVTSKGTYSWGGAAGTSFWIDPALDLVGIYMVQIRPQQRPPDQRVARYKHADRFRTLAYQALLDSSANAD